MDERVKRLIVWIATNAWRDSVLSTTRPEHHVNATSLLDAIVETFSLDKDEVGHLVDEVERRARGPRPRRRRGLSGDLRCPETAAKAKPGFGAAGEVQQESHMIVKIRILGRLPLCRAVKNFAEASRETRAAIENANIGSGAFGGADVLQGRDIVARVSYNGRVWPPVAWSPSLRALWSPGDTTPA